MEKQYEHDCINCVFLGQFKSEKNYDLYVCPSKDKITINTIVARYSNEGPDYISGLEFALIQETNQVNLHETGKVLLECLKRAESQGFKRHKI